MKYINTKLLILTLALIGLSSTAVVAKPDKLSTEQWELLQINGRAVDNSKAYLEVNIGRTRFTGNTGCNQMFGKRTRVTCQRKFIRFCHLKLSEKLQRNYGK